jgi:hypothetical protein
MAKLISFGMNKKCLKPNNYEALVAEFNADPQKCVEKYESLAEAAKDGDEIARQKILLVRPLWWHAASVKDVTVSWDDAQITMRCLDVFGVRLPWGIWDGSAAARKDLRVNVKTVMEDLITHMNMGGKKSEIDSTKNEHAKMLKIFGVLLGHITWGRVMLGKMGRDFSMLMAKEFKLSIDALLGREAIWQTTKKGGLMMSSPTTRYEGVNETMQKRVLANGFTNGALSEFENTMEELDVKGRLRCVKLFLDEVELLMDKNQYEKFEKKFLHVGRKENSNYWLDVWGLGNFTRWVRI